MKHPFDKVLLTSTVNELSSEQKFWFASSIAGIVGEKWSLVSLQRKQIRN